MNTQDTLDDLRDELRNATKKLDPLLHQTIEVDCQEATHNVDLTTNIVDYIEANRNETSKRLASTVLGEYNSDFTKRRISVIFDKLKDLVLYKNEKYGNAALEPLGIFSKLDAKSSILIRLDDKLRRVQNSNEIRTNDISDLIGYLVLLLVQTGATGDDIERQKD